MIADVAIALGVVLGVVGLVKSWRGPTIPIVSTLATLEADPDDVMTVEGRPSEAWRPDRALGRVVAEGVASRGWWSDRLLSDLDVTGSSIEFLCAQAALAASVGFLVAPAMWAILTTGGIRLPVVLPLWAAGVCAAAGAVLPIWTLQVEAARARTGARAVVGAYLDLVVLCLAGGMGIEGALHAAAQIGNTDLSRRIQSSLIRSRDSGEAPWKALATLGTSIGIDELDELAALVSLAGTEGARIRSSLAAKASSIRRHRLAEAETNANTITARLFLPGVLLLMGFLVFIGYPALTRITSGL